MTLNRRQFVGIGASVTALGSAGAFGQATPEFPHRGEAVVGPGIVRLTKVVPTQAGPVQGLVVDGIHTFKGLRYGAPPVGDLRFKPPRKPEPLTHVWDASDFGAPSFQATMRRSTGHVSDFEFQLNRALDAPSVYKLANEDCLFLNVWTPGTDKKRRPVMVWLHGGGFAVGSGAQQMYQGDGLARFGDVVVVTVNHRLTVFGYLHLAELMGPEYAGSGTAGVQDLQLALEWIRDNIEAFGGDPGNVMVMGQSGGGSKVEVLMGMPAARGLIHKAAAHSGPANPLITRDKATESAGKLLAALGIKPGDVKALQAVTPQALMAAVGKTGGVDDGPVLDGAIIPEDPYGAASLKASAKIPLLIGWTKDEYSFFAWKAAWFGSMTEAELQRRVTTLGANAERLLAAYRHEYPSYTPTFLWNQLIGSRFRQASEEIAVRRATAAPGSVYVWSLSWDTPVAGGILKSPHTLDIPFVLYSFDRVRSFVGPGNGPKLMAEQMAGAWVAFARSGKPGHKGLPQWAPYDVATRPVMDFNTRSRLVNDPQPEVRKALAEIPMSGLPPGVTT